MNIKKTFRLCPNKDCKYPIPRKNFRAEIRKCKKCFKLTCEHCRIENMCLSCWLEIKTPSEPYIYFKDKYSNTQLIGVTA